MSSLAIKGNGLQSELLRAAVIALGALSFGSSRSAEARASTRQGRYGKAGRRWRELSKCISDMCR